MNRDFLIVALDVEPAEAYQLIDKLGDKVTTYKVGMYLYYKEGRKILEYLAGRDKKVFLDLKLNDIPNTISNAVRVLTSEYKNISLFTLFSGAAAVKAAYQVAPAHVNILNVTVLTSEELNAPDAVERRTGLSLEAGAAGVVCSGLETAALRDRFGDDFLIVNPGIRPALSEKGDQKRVVTPAEAAGAGASHIVVGRPVYQADEPSTAVDRILSEISG